MEDNDCSGVKQKSQRFLRECRNKHRRAFFARNRLVDSLSDSSSDFTYSAATPDLESVWESATGGQWVDWGLFRRGLIAMPPFKSSCSVLSFEGVVSCFLQEQDPHIDQMAALDCLFLLTSLVSARLGEATFGQFLRVIERSTFDFAVGTKITAIIAQCLADSQDNLALSLRSSTLQALTFLDPIPEQKKIFEPQFRMGKQLGCGQVYFESLNFLFQKVILFSAIPAQHVRKQLSATLPNLFSYLRDPENPPEPLEFLATVLANHVLDEAGELPRLLPRLFSCFQDPKHAQNMSLYLKIFHLSLRLGDKSVTGAVLDGLGCLGSWLIETLNRQEHLSESEPEQIQSESLYFLRTVLETKDVRAFEFFGNFSLGPLVLQRLQQLPADPKIEPLLALTLEILAIQEYFQNESLAPFAIIFELISAKIHPFSIFLVAPSTLGLLVRVWGFAFDLEAHLCPSANSPRGQGLVALCAHHCFMPKVLALQSHPDSELRELAAELMDRYLEFLRRN